MKIVETSIPDVKIITPNIFNDSRGYFFESYNKKTFAEALGLEYCRLEHSFVQDNHSHSKKNVLRGLHYQIKNPQGKLVRVVGGVVYDVVVDLRKCSSSYGQWVSTLLSEENHRMLWVPPQFAHGFLVLSDSADLLYKTTDFYDPLFERCLKWNDPDVAIDWPLKDAPILSAKDQQGEFLKNLEVFS